MCKIKLSGIYTCNYQYTQDYIYQGKFKFIFNSDGSGQFLHEVSIYNKKTKNLFYGPATGVDGFKIIRQNFFEKEIDIVFNSNPEKIEKINVLSLGNIILIKNFRNTVKVILVKI